MDPETYKRLLDESADIGERIGKLVDFIATAYYQTLDDRERWDLVEQLIYMRNYDRVLCRRIARAQVF